MVRTRIANAPSSCAAALLLHLRDGRAARHHHGRRARDRSATPVSQPISMRVIGVRSARQREHRRQARCSTEMSRRLCAMPTRTIQVGRLALVLIGFGWALRRGARRRSAPPPSRIAASAPNGVSALSASFTSCASRARAPATAEQIDQRRLAVGGVLAGGLAERCGVAFDVEQVVGDLERLADRLAVAARRASRLAFGALPRIAPATQQKCRIAPVFIACSVSTSCSPCGVSFVAEAAFGREVEHLAADHAAEAGGAREPVHQRDPHRRRRDASRAAPGRRRRR